MESILPKTKYGSFVAIGISISVLLGTIAPSIDAHAVNRRCIEDLRNAVRSLTPSAIKTGIEVKRIKKLIHDQESDYLNLLKSLHAHDKHSLSMDQIRAIRRTLSDATSSIHQLQQRRHELEGGFRTITMLDEFVGESLGLDEWRIEKRFDQEPVIYFTNLQQREAHRARIDAKGYFKDHRERMLEGFYNFVMNQDGEVFVMKIDDAIREGARHSSFLAGGPVAASGELHFVGGMIKEASAFSGHYEPERDVNAQFFEMLRRRGIDISKIRNTHEMPLDWE